MKVAIIHDSLHVYGGAEKVLEQFHRIYPEAPIFTTLYRPEAFPAYLRGWNVKAARFNRLPMIDRFHRQAFFLYPFSMSGINLGDFDVVLSSSYNFAHHVTCAPNARHYCYCHSPPRFLWDPHGYARRENMGPVSRLVHKAMLMPLRVVDRSASQGVDTWISTSRLVQDRIAKYYRRDSMIIPPPVDLDEFHVEKAPSKDYYLMVMRMVGWKRPDIVIEACNRLGLPLVVAGDGRELSRLKAMAGPTITFAGRVDGQAKANLYANCKALILPSEEDFGITPLEAMASGRPVLALRAGGALDTVAPGVAGEFFDEQTADNLADHLSRFDPDAYDPAVIRSEAQRFDSAVFRDRIAEIVEGRREERLHRVTKVARAESRSVTAKARTYAEGRAP